MLKALKPSFPNADPTMNGEIQMTNNQPTDRLNGDDLVHDSGEFITHVLSKSDFWLDEDTDWYLLEETIEPIRIKELDDGAASTSQERTLLRAQKLKHRLEIPDDDICPGVWFCQPPSKSSMKGVIVVICRGYSFSEVKRSILGLFETEEAALCALRERFYLASDFSI